MFGRNRILIIGIFLFFLFVTASSTVESNSSDKPEWIFVVLPDTQYYSQDYPEIFYAQTQWIRSEVERGAVDLVLGVGDIVNYNDDNQWVVASNALAELDGNVPYILSVGNHDFEYGKVRESKFSQYFSPERLGLGGTFEEGRSENGWRIVEVRDTEYLILTLEVFPRDDVLRWAKGVLEEYSKYKTIIITHAYLYEDGMRYGEVGTAEQEYGAQAMKNITGTAFGASNDAETIYQELVKPFSQVQFVFSGHILGDGTAYRSDAREDGSIANQVVQNYQMRENGGEGYLRIYVGYKNRIEVKTYSPVLDGWMYDPEHEFVLPSR